MTGRSRSIGVLMTAVFTALTAVAIAIPTMASGQTASPAGACKTTTFTSTSSIKQLNKAIGTAKVSARWTWCWKSVGGRNTVYSAVNSSCLATVNSPHTVVRKSCHSEHSGTNMKAYGDGLYQPKTCVIGGCHNLPRYAMLQLIQLRPNGGYAYLK